MITKGQTEQEKENHDTGESKTAATMENKNRPEIDFQAQETDEIEVVGRTWKVFGKEA